jgi:hypothetical protein
MCIRSRREVPRLKALLTRAGNSSDSDSLEMLYGFFLVGVPLAEPARVKPTKVCIVRPGG